MSVNSADEEKILWRGTSLPDSLVEDYKKHALGDEDINMMGFTSTTKDKRVAEGYAFEKMAV